MSGLRTGVEPPLRLLDGLVRPQPPPPLELAEDRQGAGRSSGEDSVR